jgi:hypothetical protein
MIASIAGIYWYGASSELPLRVGMTDMEAYEAMGRPLGSRGHNHDMYLSPKPDILGNQWEVVIWFDPDTGRVTKWEKRWSYRETPPWLSPALKAVGW